MKTNMESYWLVIGVVIFYLTVPVILIHQVQYFNADLDAVSLDPERRIPKSVDKYLVSARATLESLGFVPLGPLLLKNTIPNTVAIVELFVNRPKCDTAMVSYLYGLADGAVVSSIKYVEFIRRFRGDNLKLIQTNNVKRPGAFRDHPTDLNSRFPTISNIEELYALHLMIVRQEATGLKPYLRIDEEFAGDQVLFLETVFRESFQKQTERGWLAFDDVKNRWHPTVKGAILMTWQELFPFKQLRTAHLYYRARRQLAELRANADFSQTENR